MFYQEFIIFTLAIIPAMNSARSASAINIVTAMITGGIICRCESTPVWSP